MAARLTALLVIVAATVAAVLAEASVPLPERAAAAPQPVPVPPATSGVAHCPSPAEPGEGVRIDLAPLGDVAAGVVVEVGGREAARTTLEPGSVERVDVGPERAAAPVSVRWQGAPVAAVVATDGDRPVAMRCTEVVARRWFLAGFDTTLGNGSDLVIANPFSVDAVVGVSYATPDGPVDLVTTTDVAVPAGEQVVIDLDEVQPEVGRLGAVVDVRTGRAVVVGRQRFGRPPDLTETVPADATPDADGASAAPGDAAADEVQPTRGRSLVPAVARPAREQTVPFAAVGAADAAALVLMNPGDDDALVDVTTSAPDDSAEPVSDLRVPAGSTVHVALAGLSQRRTFAVHVSSGNDVPVVAARTATREDPDGAGADVSAAVPSARTWLAMGGRTDDGDARIDIANVADEAVTVTLVPIGATQPAAWRELQIEVNGQRGIDLSDVPGRRGVLPVRVESDGPVAVSVRAAGAAGLRSVAGWRLPDPGEPGGDPATRPSIRRSTSLAVSPVADEEAPAR